MPFFKHHRSFSKTNIILFVVHKLQICIIISIIDYNSTQNYSLRMITLEKGYMFLSAEFSEELYTSTLAEAFLHNEEISKISKAIKKRQSEFLAARIIAKKAYFELSKKAQNYSSLLIKKDAHGAPFFEDENYRLSITHDENIAAAFVSCKTSPFAGIDAEKINDKNTKVIIKYISTNEREIVESLESTLGLPTAAAAIWTAKEAMSKYLGLGFSVFPSLSVSDIKTDGAIVVTFADYKDFGAVIKFCGDTCFAFAAKLNDFEKPGLKTLEIAPKPIDYYIKSTSD